MGLMSFMKEAGEKLFGRGEAKAAQEAAASAPTAENVAALSKAQVRERLSGKRMPCRALLHRGQFQRCPATGRETSRLQVWHDA